MMCESRVKEQDAAGLQQVVERVSRGKVVGKPVGRLMRTAGGQQPLTGIEHPGGELGNVGVHPSVVVEHADELRASAPLFVT